MKITRYQLRELRMKLTPKETAVITLVASGYSDKEIGVILKISYGTVRDYMDKLVLKLQARNRTHAAILYAKTNTEWLFKIK